MYPVDNNSGKVNLSKSRPRGEHSNVCIVKSRYAKVLVGHLKDTTADNSNDKKPPTKTSPTIISVEMHVKTEDLAVVNLTHPPVKI